VRQRLLIVAAYGLRTDPTALLNGQWIAKHLRRA
jgi:hypothetical protein